MTYILPDWSRDADAAAEEVAYDTDDLAAIIGPRRAGEFLIGRALALFHQDFGNQHEAECYLHKLAGAIVQRSVAGQHWH